MQKKILLQLFLFLLFFVSASIFLKTYFFNTDDKIILNKNDQKKINEDENRDKSNTIYNIEYISKDKKGNSYTIKSNSGEIDSNKSELISMNDVTANINLLNSSPIIISADNAIYNNISHETNFYNNVKVRYVTANITSENMDLLATENTANIYNNVRLNNPEGNLLADIVNYDFNTKNFKVSMFDGEAVQMQVTQ